MTADVNAAVAGARAAGATSFVVEENHGFEMCATCCSTRSIRPWTWCGASPVGYGAHTISYETCADVRLLGRTVSEGRIVEYHPEFRVPDERTLAFEHDQMAVAYRMACIAGTPGRARAPDLSRGGRGGGAGRRGAGRGQRQRLADGQGPSGLRPGSRPGRHRSGSNSSRRTMVLNVAKNTGSMSDPRRSPR